MYFIDFEFFGVDDPVKLISDTLQHPGSLISKNDNEYLKVNLNKIFSNDFNFEKRFEILFPIFGLKWCLIMLNPFLKNYKIIGTDKASIQKDQFNKVIIKFNEIKKLY